MGREIIQHDADKFGTGVVDIDEVTHAVRQSRRRRDDR